MLLATPVVDDVTLTYFLPSPEILSWENLSVNRQALARAAKGDRGVRARLGDEARGRRAR
jgi:hypothetical protein